jgi:hypothetical protein
MKARELIEGATYDPVQLKIIGQAFDNAWHQIGPKVGRDPRAIEKARAKLAKVILSVARNGIESADQLKEAAPQADVCRSLLYLEEVARTSG